MLGRTGLAGGMGALRLPFQLHCSAAGWLWTSPFLTFHCISLEAGNYVLSVGGMVKVTEVLGRWTDVPCYNSRHEKRCLWCSVNEVLKSSITFS